MAASTEAISPALVCRNTFNTSLQTSYVNAVTRRTLHFVSEQHLQKTHLNKMTFDYAVLQECPPGTEQKKFHVNQTVPLVDFFWQGFV